MRIATWNVERLPTRARAQMVRESLRTVDADVWVLTETNDSLSPGPDYHSLSSGAPDRASRPGERWVTIWSRLPIEPLGDTADTARAAMALVRPQVGPPLVIYGTVLPWLGSSWRGIAGAGGRAFSAALAAQHSDWTRLRRSVPDAELCILGDLNQDLSDRHYYGSSQNRAALRGAMASVGLVALTADPADPVRSIAPARASIDHICVPRASTHFRSPRLTVWPKGLTPDRRLSDHFGVAASSDR